MRPYYQAWEGEGEDGPWDQGKDEAFQRMMPAIRSNMQLGQFKKDLVAGSAGSSGFCSLPEVQCAGPLRPCRALHHPCLLLLFAETCNGPDCTGLHAQLHDDAAYQAV